MTWRTSKCLLRDVGSIVGSPVGFAPRRGKNASHLSHPSQTRHIYPIFTHVRGSIVMQVDGTVAGSVYYLEAIVPVWHNSGTRTWRSDLWTPRGAVRGGGGISINSEPFIDSQKGCLTRTHWTRERCDWPTTLIIGQSEEWRCQSRSAEDADWLGKGARSRRVRRETAFGETFLTVLSRPRTKRYQIRQFIRLGDQRFTHASVSMFRCFFGSEIRWQVRPSSTGYGDERHPAPPMWPRSVRQSANFRGC